MLELDDEVSYCFAIDLNIGDIGIEDRRIVTGDESIIFEGEEKTGLAGHAIADND